MPKKDLAVIAARLKRARTLGGLNQRELSTLAGLSLSYCWSVEAEKFPPRPPALAALADVLGVPRAWLGGHGTGEPEEKAIRRAVKRAQTAAKTAAL